MMLSRQPKFVIYLPPWFDDRDRYDVSDVIQHLARFFRDHIFNKRQKSNIGIESICR
jgi:hypothetical protein